VVRILVVDGDPRVQALLRAEGHEVVEAGDGESLLAVSAEVELVVAGAKALEAALEELRGQQDETLARLAHDLRSPIAVILASLDYLAEQELGEGAREALEDARQAASRMARLTSSLVTVTRRRSPP
jgi:signal transduction histidine kinase